MIKLQKYQLRLLHAAVLIPTLLIAACGQGTDSAGQSDDLVAPGTTTSPIGSDVATVRAANGSIVVAVGDTPGFTLDAE